MSGSRRAFVWLTMLGLVAGGGYTLYHDHRQAVTAARDAGYARVGAVVFQTDCATCHGVGGDGAGGAPALNDGTVLKTYATEPAIQAFIAGNMPASAPGTLSPGEARDVAWYILSVNGRLP